MIEESTKLIDPPSSLFLQRRSIQTFSNNQKVALYYCRELKKYFSLTYNKDGYDLLETDFSVVDKLKNIEDVESLFFNDGSQINIDKEFYNHILELYDSLSEGKYDFIEKVMNDLGIIIHFNAIYTL